MLGDLEKVLTVFHDNRNSFLGADAEVEAGIPSMNGRRIPAQGGREQHWPERLSCRPRTPHRELWSMHGHRNRPKVG